MLISFLSTIIIEFLYIIKENIQIPNELMESIHSSDH